MPRGVALVLLLLPGTLFAGDDTPLGLELPPTSARARRLREQAEKLWAPVVPLWEAARAGRTVDPPAARKALPAIEQAVGIWEKSLHIEWHAAANRTLAQAVRAWYKLRPLAQAPAPPADDAARRKAEHAAQREVRERTKAVRRFVLDYGKERRHTSQLRRCPKCEGRKDLLSPFGDSRPCPVCNRHGMLIDRDGIIQAHWLRRSPLYREQTRNMREVERALKTGSYRPDSLAPFVRAVSIREWEDHDVWVRIWTKEKVYDQPHSKRSRKRDDVYTLYRVGRVWYLYSRRFDRGLLDIPDLEKAE